VVVIRGLEILRIIWDGGSEGDKGSAEYLLIFKNRLTEIWFRGMDTTHSNLESERRL
jgi:hypothetical protein